MEDRATTVSSYPDREEDVVDQGLFPWKFLHGFFFFGGVVSGLATASFLAIVHYTPPGAESRATLDLDGVEELPGHITHGILTQFCHFGTQPNISGGIWGRIRSARERESREGEKDKFLTFPHISRHSCQLLRKNRSCSGFKLFGDIFL